MEDINLLGGLTALAGYAIVIIGGFFVIGVVFALLRRDEGIIGSIFNLLLMIVRKWWLWLLIYIVCKFAGIF